MHWLETRIPPPILLAFFGAAAVATSASLPSITLDLPWRTSIALGLVVVGSALNILPKISFKRAQTTTNPLRPGATTSLVTSGVYRYTRNPMYLGHATILLGWLFYLANAVGFLALPAFMIYISRFQIHPEERHLSARFPAAYAAYCHQSPRWL